MRLALPSLVLSVSLAACVSSGKYQKKEAEALKLAEDVKAEQAHRAELQKSFEALQKDLDAMSVEATALRERVKGYEATQTALQQKSAEYEQMAAALKGQIEQGKVEVSELKGRMTVKLKDKILFSSGSAKVGKEGRDALASVAGVLKDVQGKVVRVEGHTDDVPAGGAYPSNWELSTARALAVVRFLESQGLDPSRLAAAGYGEHRPVAANDTPEGRSQNRRIEIVLAAADDVPPAAPPPAAPPVEAPKP
jgi:chemotaxis protein MotB